MQEILKCSFCGSDQRKILFKGGDLLYKTPGLYAFFECNNCGLIFLDPQPSIDDLDAIYPTNYHAFPVAVQEEKSLFLRLDKKEAINRKREFVIKNTRPQGRILDVGCSTGIFLDGMRTAGWDVCGVEPSSFAAKYARNYFGLDIQNCSFEESVFSKNQFDVVTFWDVAEHLPNPYQAFHKAADILKPGGSIILNVPNPRGFERFIFNESWLGWDIPRHFYIFSQDVLDLMLITAGFKKSKIESITGFYGAFLISVQMWLTHKSTPLKLSKVIMKFLNLLPLRILSIPIFRIAATMNRSSFYAAIAQKKDSNDEISS